MSTVVSSASQCTPPPASAQIRNGMLATRKASAAIHAAASLPSTISAGESRVTCSVASVPAFRSPLIAPEERVGATSSPRNSTKPTTTL
jgi:hypothetical protein